MVGRPSFPPDVDERDDLQGAAAQTQGLTALDQERAASLADEGGVSGAVVETQDEDEARRLAESLPGSDVAGTPASTKDRGRATWWACAAALALAALGLLLLRRT